MLDSHICPTMTCMRGSSSALILMTLSVVADLESSTLSIFDMLIITLILLNDASVTSLILALHRVLFRWLAKVVLDCVTHRHLPSATRLGDILV